MRITGNGDGRVVGVPSRVTGRRILFEKDGQILLTKEGEKVFGRVQWRVWEEEKFRTSALELVSGGKQISNTQ